MNRIEFTARLLGTLRQEKNFPIARYSIVMAAAAGGPAGASVREMAAMLSEPATNMGGCLGKVAESGFVLCIDPLARPQRWTPTDKGLAIVARLTARPPNNRAGV